MIARITQGLIGFTYAGITIGGLVAAATILVNGTVTGLGDALVLTGWFAAAYAAVFAALGLLAGVLTRSSPEADQSGPTVASQVTCACATFAAFVLGQAGVQAIWPWRADDTQPNLAISAGLAITVLIVCSLLFGRFAAATRRSGRGLTWILGLGSLVMVAVAAGSRTIEEQDPDAPTGLAVNDKRVFLLAVDGVDGHVLQRLIDDGRLPNFERLLSGGTYGSLQTLLPCWSPILWTTVATGHPEERHGIRSFTEVLLPGMDQGIQRTMGEYRLLAPYLGTAPLGRIFEQPWMPHNYIHPISVLHRRSKPLWTILSEYGVDVGVVGWFPSWPAEVVDGFVVSDNDPYRNLADHINTGRSYVAAHGLTHPPELVEELAKLEDNPWQNPLSEWSLDDTAALPLFEGVFGEGLESVEDWDRPLRILLARHLADRFSTSTTTHLLEQHAPRFMAVYLESIDRAGHLFGDPYPEVVDRTYEFIDELLGRIVAKAPADTNWVIVSDHGWTDDQGRLAAHEHGPPGVMILNGPAFREGFTGLQEPTVFDVAPTVLGTLGLPPTLSMPGRALREAFTAEAATDLPNERIPGYGPHRPRWAVTSWDSAQDERGASGVQDQLRALGYVK